MANRVEIERRGQAVVVLDNEEKVVLLPEPMPQTAEDFVRLACASEECHPMMWYVRQNEQPVYVNGQLLPWHAIAHLFEAV